MDSKYHFSCQFTADIIAMNAADFIITSTYQEIAGRLEKLQKFRNLTFPDLLRFLFTDLSTFQQESGWAIRKPCFVHDARAL